MHMVAMPLYDSSDFYSFSREYILLFSENSENHSWPLPPEYEEKCLTIIQCHVSEMFCLDTVVIGYRRSCLTQKK